MLCIFLQKQSDYFSNDPRTCADTCTSTIRTYTVLPSVPTIFNGWVHAQRARVALASLDESADQYAHVFK